MCRECFVQSVRVTEPSQPFLMTYCPICRDKAALHTTTFVLLLNGVIGPKGFHFLPMHYSKDGFCLAVKSEEPARLHSLYVEDEYDYFFLDGAVMASRFADATGDSDWDLTRMHARISELCQTNIQALSLMFSLGWPRKLVLGDWCKAQERLQALGML